MADGLEAKLDKIAKTPVLIAATDFDGTLAPIVADPAAAVAHPEAIVALRALAALSHTHVAVISGRARADLAQRIPDLADVHLVGSHGSEFGAGFATDVPGDAAARLAGAREFLTSLAVQHEGCHIEVKPASLAFHFRNASEDAGASAVRLIQDNLKNWPGIHIGHGKKVVELNLSRTNKGDALQRLREQLGATAVLFLGDDVTDEDAFATLSISDVGIKIGPGATKAAYRVADPLQSAWLLAHVAERRAAWLAAR